MTYWHIIRCVSGQEGKAERYLERLGYPHGWHPTEKVRLSESVFQRMARAAKGKLPKRYRVKPFVTGYVFIPADAIDVDKIKRNVFGAWLDPLIVNGAPYRVTESIMAEMKQVPDRVRELLDEAEQAKRAEWEAKRPVVGGKAKVIAGPFEGHVVDVVSISSGRLVCDVGGLPGGVMMREEMLERVA